MSLSKPTENVRKRFLTFSGDIEMEHWAKMGQCSNSTFYLMFTKLLLLNLISQKRYNDKRH